MGKTKKNGKRFGGFGKRQYLCTRNKAVSRKHRNIGIWCNGNTADSGPAFPGSNPGIPTKRNLLNGKFLFCLIYPRIFTKRGGKKVLRDTCQSITYYFAKYYVLLCKV